MERRGASGRLFVFLGGEWKRLLDGTRLASGRGDRLRELDERARGLVPGLGPDEGLAIIGAFLHDPQIVFMDEPTVGLDPRSARLIKDLMIRYRDRGRTIFFSTHILEIAQTMCDRVIIINKGQIIADAQVNELRRMRGDQSLEDIFLELTGGREVDDMVKELQDGN